MRILNYDIFSPDNRAKLYIWLNPLFVAITSNKLLIGVRKWL